MKRLARLGAIGASIVSAGCLTVGMGVASADAIINTGPGSYNAILADSSFSHVIRNTNMVNIHNQNYQSAFTGSATVNGNTNTYGGNNYGNNNQCNHGNYGTTTNYRPWIKVRKMDHVMPANHYYQPQMYGSNDYSTSHPAYGGSGGEYSNSHENYGNNSYGGQGGSATTGNASNYNATQANVSITNNTPSLSSMGTTSAGGNSTISDTGPHSFNLISSTSSSNFQETNTNNVDITNTNNQTAVSGNATVSGNTRGGSATTGNATNNNNTDIEVAITNN